MRVDNEKHSIESIALRARIKRLETEEELLDEIQRKADESKALKKLLENLNNIPNKRNQNK